MVDGFEPAAGGSPQPTQSHRSGAVPMSGIVPGALLNRRYLIDELIGSGAIAWVYRGFDQVLARSVAVKVFHPGIADPGNISRERTEMQIQANLHHRHLVTLYDAKFGADPESHPRSDALQRTGPGAQLTYLVMELVDGGTLADRIGPNGLAAVDVARVGAAAAAGLAAVHQFGMVHRDIRPSNILLSTAGEVKVSDFGFARELEAERVTAAAAAGFDGSTAYLSPEQARGGAVGPPTDVYALGLVLLESLTGHREYPGQAMESAVSRLQREPVVPEALPGNWPTLLRAMTNADPARRPTAALAEEALSGLASPVSAPARRPVPAVPPAPYQHKQPPSFGRILAVVLLVLLVTAGVVIGTVAVIRNNETNTDTPTETITISPTIPPTSLVTTTERITETSRETMAPTPTTPPTLPAPGIGGSQGTEASPIPETPTS